MIVINLNLFNKHIYDKNHNNIKFTLISLFPNSFFYFEYQTPNSSKPKKILFQT